MLITVYLNDREASYIDFKQVLGTDDGGIWFTGGDRIHIPISSILYTCERKEEDDEQTAKTASQNGRVG